jgi:hypothetical protein
VSAEAAYSVEGWQGILDPGERILWQGQPDSSVRLADLNPKQSLIGLAILAFALFWTISAIAAAADQGFVTLFFAGFGLFFIWIGFQRAGGYLLIDGYTRSRTWYTLTDRRAFVGTEVFGKRKLRSFPIGPETVLTIDDEIPGSIWFAKAYGKTGRHDVGFRRIDGARQVYDLMRKVQRGQA